MFWEGPPLTQAKGKAETASALKDKFSQANFSFYLMGRVELRGSSRGTVHINTEKPPQGLLLCLVQWQKWQALESIFIQLRLESKINVVILDPSSELDSLRPSPEGSRRGRGPFGQSPGLIWEKGGQGVEAGPPVWSWDSQKLWALIL